MNLNERPFFFVAFFETELFNEFSSIFWQETEEK